MAMAKNAIRAFSWWLPASRNLCAATVAMDPAVAAENAAPPEFKPLYRRLSALGGRAWGSVSETMSEWLREGRKVTEIELLDFVRQFRKYKSYRVALEVQENGKAEQSFWKPLCSMLGRDKNRVIGSNVRAGYEVTDSGFKQSRSIFLSPSDLVKQAP